jgi:hypothetical protein
MHETVRSTFPETVGTRRYNGGLGFISFNIKYRSERIWLESPLRILSARFIVPIVYISPVGFLSDDPLVNRVHGGAGIDEDVTGRGHLAKSTGQTQNTPLAAR